MGREGNLFVNGQIGKEGFDFCYTHVFGMAFVMKEDESPDPGDVGLLSANRVVPQGDATRCLRRISFRSKSRSFGFSGSVAFIGVSWSVRG